MDWYYYIALAAIASQLIFLLQTYNNYRYALNKYKRKRTWYRPRTVLIVPCKGLDSAFQKNIASFFDQDYENYLLWFVVAEESDPAYTELKQTIDILSRIKDMRCGIDQALIQKRCNEAERLAYFVDSLVMQMEYQIPALREARRT